MPAAAEREVAAFLEADARLEEHAPGGPRADKAAFVAAWKARAAALRALRAMVVDADEDTAAALFPLHFQLGGLLE
jgi:hypothetical protein